jgi:hypothetical protein
MQSFVLNTKAPLRRYGVLEDFVMSELLSFPTRCRAPKDDLGPARGAIIAAIAGLSIWASIFVIAHWIFN